MNPSAAIADPLQQKEKQEKEKQKAQPVENKETEEQKKALKKLNNRFQQLEVDLAKARAEKEKFEKQLSDPSIYEDKEKFQSALAAFNMQETKLKKVITEWEDVFEQLSEFEEKD